jgi:dodecin
MASARGDPRARSQAQDCASADGHDVVGIPTRRQAASTPGAAAARRVAITQGRQHHGCTRTTNRRSRHAGPEGEKSMPDSVYKIIELVGTSTESWEKAAGAAVTQAAKTLRDLRIVEVAQLDMQVQNGKVKTYRAKVKVSFKFEGKK